MNKSFEKEYSQIDCSDNDVNGGTQKKTKCSEDDVQNLAKEKDSKMYTKLKQERRESAMYKQ